MKWMTIGEVARRMGLRMSAVRYYENAGLLPKPLRTGGQRRYDREVLERLAIVRFAKHVGFKVTEVRQLLAGIYGRPLMETLHHKCPHLVERGNAIDQDKQKPTDS